MTGPVPSEPLLCKFADGGQKKRQSQGKYLQNGRPWTRDGETVSFDFSSRPLDFCENTWWCNTSSVSTLIGVIMTQSIVGFFLQGGMTLTYDPTTALQNGSVLLIWQIQRKFHHVVVVTHDFLFLSVGSTPPLTALPPTEWLGRLPSPHTCIHLCPPTR